MSAAHIMDTILQDTSDKKVRWFPFNSFDKEEAKKFEFTHRQHFVPSETVYCNYNGHYFFLVTHQAFDFTRNAISSSFSLISFDNNEQTEFSADQRKLNELKSLIFLNSLS